MNPHVNYGLGVIMMCHVGSSVVTDTLPLVGHVDNGKLCMGRGGYGKSLYSLLNFAVNSKLL